MRRRAWMLAIAAAWLAVGGTAALGQSAAQPGASKPAFIIYASPNARKLLAADNYDLKARVNRWRDFLRERGASFTIVTHPVQLAQMPAGDALILPSAVVLGDDERRLIAQRIAAGESLLATWMPDTLDARSEPVAAKFIEQTFQVAARTQPFADKGFLVTVGDTPFTHAIAAGTRLWVGKEQRYRTPLLATTGAGYLADWSRTPGESGLIAFATVGKSRRVLLGWPENAWDPKSPEYRALAGAAIDWIEGRPIAYAKTWPWPYRGAVTVGVDALWRFENVPHVAELAARHGAHASFHFLPADARANAALVRDLVKSGQSVGGFGDDAQPFAGQPEAEQRARIERMAQAFRDALGADFSVRGLRAPQGATDAATEKAAASLDYLVDVGRVDSAVPLLSDGRHLVVLSASTNLDATSTADAIAAGFAGATTRTRTLGGYAFVGVDAAALTRESAVDAALATFIESTAAGKADAPWAASAADVAEWWRARAQLRISSAWSPGDSTMTLEVVAAEALRFPLAIAIEPPPGAKNVRLEEVEGAQLQADAAGNPAVVLSALPAGAKRLRIRFLP